MSLSLKETLLIFGFIAGVGVGAWIAQTMLDKLFPSCRRCGGSLKKQGKDLKCSICGRID